MQEKTTTQESEILVHIHEIIKQAPTGKRCFWTVRDIAKELNERFKPKRLSERKVSLLLQKNNICIFRGKVMHLTQADVTELTYYANSELSTDRVKNRAKALLLYNTSINMHHIAHMLNVDRSLVAGTIDRYMQGGVLEALYIIGVPLKPLISSEETQAVIAIAKTTPPVGMTRWTMKDIFLELQKQSELPDITYSKVKEIVQNEKINLTVKDTGHVKSKFALSRDRNLAKRPEIEKLYNAGHNEIQIAFLIDIPIAAVKRAIKNIISVPNKKDDNIASSPWIRD